MQVTKDNKKIIIWLLSVCLLILFMIMVGGITRLTDSGLSMVEWKPILGTIPPLNDADWNTAFAKYKNFPEFQKINSQMTLSEFKFIYFWEYFHRVTGRLIGLVFFFPMVFFLFKRQIKKNFKIKMVLGFILGAMQGVLGWYMVQSGLIDRPDVSHFRLAAHLSLAFFILCYLSWLVFDLLFQGTLETKAKSFKWSLGLLLLTTVQIVWGAFVAGLDAGLGYNTFPLMGQDFMPSFLFEGGISSLYQEKFTIQFIHRWLGVSILVYVLCGFWYFRTRLNTTRQSLGLKLVLLSTLLQVVLGILTLVYVVPLSLGVIHQVMAAILLITIIHFLHSHRVNKQI
jgi:cytochrome c oxidase assembly protein subunit 15